jgi:WD40 repeat protein
MGTHERDLARTTILMYEIGTGIAAAEVNSIFDITRMEFSSDGRYLAIGSLRGSVSVWAVGDHIYR